MPTPLSYELNKSPGQARSLVRSAMLPLLTFLLLMVVTLMLWAHERAISTEFVQTRVSQSRLRIARRIQTQVETQLRPLRRLSDEMVRGIVATPQDFQRSVQSIRREEPQLRFIAWIDRTGNVISVEPPTPVAAMKSVFTPSSDALFDRLAGAPTGSLLPVENPSVPPGDVNRFIALPLSHTEGKITGAIVACETTRDMLGTGLLPDARGPINVRVEDDRGQQLFVSGDDSTLLPLGAKKHSADVDLMRVLDQAWSVSVQSAPGARGLRPSDDTNAFLISGSIVSLVVAGTVAQTGRHRRRERRTTQAHLSALEALHSVAASISNEPRSPEVVLDQLTDTARRLLAIPKALIGQLEAGDIVRIALAKGFDPAPTWTVRPLKDLPGANQCLRTGEMLVVGDVETDSSPLDSAEMLRNGIRAILIFPLFAGSERIGVMSLADDRPRRFTEQELRLARLWASQAAVTLANHRLAAAVDENLRAQKKLNEQIQHDADAKAMLLRELNHRVKNNLAGIVGLLSADVPDLSLRAQDWLDRAISRIQTLARAHELFVGTSTAVGLAELVENTLDPVRAIKPMAVEINTDLAANVPVGTDQAVTLAMVVHELAYNALAHGVGEHGTVLIRSRQLPNGWVAIDVVDDGTRVPELPPEIVSGNVAVIESARTHQTGIGLSLVKGLVSRELHGTFSLAPNEGGGTIATIEFPVQAENVAHV